MHIAIRAASMIKENTKGGLCNKRIKKSATNTLVKKGWSTKAVIIFLKIVMLSVISKVSSKFD